MATIVGPAPLRVASPGNSASPYTILACSPATRPPPAPKTLLAPASPCSPAHAGGSVTGLECNKDCAVAKRNARLADALRITQESREKTLMQRETARYHDDLGAFARANAKFLSVVERAFEEFVNSEKKTQVLPHMPPERRKFVHDLAAIYRMDTQMVDEEPYRSVRLLRRLDTRIPSPLLSGNIASAPAPTPPNLGKLADLRSAAPSWRSPAPVSKFGPGGSFTNVNTAPRPTSAAAVAGSGSRPQPVLALSQSRLTTSASVSSVQVPPSVSGAILAQVETPAVPDSWEDDV
ncbi:hypothetical protein DXG03_000274 [Asterophora parasitica]|uniref:R3H domain-containing protein n=1 Tax=Asterophora parasitica TaxID=117018 RepID=A0A9P7GKE9_9AGAR|nr:hypothetical protein DXG03_000274 [Asterophora parasitica]